MVAECMSASLAINIHRDYEGTNTQLDTTDAVEHSRWPPGGNPVVNKESEAEEQKILENHSNNKDLDGDGLISVNHISTHRRGAKLEADERYTPGHSSYDGRFPGFNQVPKEEESKTHEECHSHDQEKAELWLVDTIVLPCTKLGDRI